MGRKLNDLFGHTIAYVRRIFRRPTPREISLEVFPRLEHLTTLGIVVGALVAGGYAASTGLGLPTILWRALLGALAAGIFGTFLGMIRTSHSERAANPDDLPSSDESNTLWDPWVDDSEDSSSAPDAALLEDEAGAPSGKARVRPRVLSTATGESMPLEDEIRSLVKSGVRGLVRIVGSNGSGKSTTLRHLRSQICPHPGVHFLDDPSHQAILAASAKSLVIYTSAQPYPRKHVAAYRLAPWGQDDLIEYLLATDAASCPSVMSRIQDSGDLGFLQGIPELWSTALDRMVQETSVGSARDALRRDLLLRLPDGEVGANVQERCLLTIVATSRTAPEELAFNPSWPVEDPQLIRLLRHRPIWILLAAERVATALAGDPTPDFLQHRFPRELVAESALLVRRSPQALARLHSVIRGGLTALHPMAASLLHASQVGWQPESGSMVNLARAYLAHASWPGIDLSNASMDGVDLTDADLAGAELNLAQIRDAELRRAKLQGAWMVSCFVTNSDLTAADLASVRANRSSFRCCNLENANFEDASLKRAHFNGSKLDAACFRGANLFGADFEGATIKEADFRNTNLQECRLRGLPLNQGSFAGAQFCGADLTGCDLEGLDLPAADFEDAGLEDALLTGSRMPEANFLGANLRNTGLAEVDWPGACLRDADLRGASFHLGSSRSGLVQSTIASEGTRTGFYTDDFDDRDVRPPEEIRKANLRDADLRGAEIDGVDFYLVDLRGAFVDFDQLEHLKQCGAILDSPS